MSETSIAERQIQPYFDMEAFMNMSRETRLGGAVLERLVKLWGEWLPESVEQAVDEAWGKSPSDGFLINNLAQFLCMAAVQELLPEVEDGGCAPSPRPTSALREALVGLGLPYKSEESSLLSRRYAVVTHFPFRGGCEICHMQSHCPKGQGQTESASILLPGYEREEEEEGKS